MITPEIAVKPAHYALKQGAFDAELNKTVEHIILATEGFVVYIATDLSVQWHTTDAHASPTYRGEVLSRATILEANSAFIEDKETLCGIRRLIAEAIAQCLDGQPKADAIRLLRAAEQQVEARSKELSWRWYFSASYRTSGIVVIIFSIMWVFRNFIIDKIGVNATEVTLGALCGPLGALISATSRANRLVMDANAGKQMHQFEGLSRIGVGAVGALFVALSIKGGLIMGGVTFSGSPLALMLALCVAAGASERLVPSLVTAFEKASLPNEPKNSGQE